MPKADKKLLLASVIALLILLFFVFDLHYFLSIEYLKINQNSIMLIRGEQPFLFVCLFMLVYICLTSLAIPSAGILALAAGAFFGVIQGALISSLCCTIGAVLNFLWSRYLFNEWMQSHFRKHLKKFNQGIEEEGGFYLFSIRLIPVFPFFVINILSGLTRIHLRDFVLSTFFSMLIVTAVFAYAGKQLSTISTASDILSVPVLSAFAVIGLMPLLSKKLIGFYKTHFGQ
ncbi:MAG: VTT domain-containing protein [Pseudomonadales bacterium]|nr:VTT domain-containing protein [Pseudomonadales bacterium]